MILHAKVIDTLLVNLQYDKIKIMTKKKRILHILKSNSYSGAENVVITICRNLKEEFDFIYVAAKGPIEEWLREEKIEYCLVDQLDYKNLKEVFDKYKPDIVHAHDFSASVISALCKKNFYLISQLHNNPPWIQRWTPKSIAYKIVKKRFDEILLVSDKIEQEAIFLNGSKDSIRVIGNPIDESYINRLANEYDVEKSDVLFLGRFTEQKRPQVFLDIIKKLHVVVPHMERVYMVGDGEQIGECREKVKLYALENVVKLEGFRKNPYPYIKNTRVLIMPSAWEGYGLVAVEAILLDTPVLANSVGGLKQVLKEIPSCLCTSEEEMVKKAQILLTDEGQYQTFVQNIKNSKKKLEGLDSYLNELRMIYGE